MSGPNIFSKIFDRLSTQERIDFARHLSLVIRAGLPIFEGLRIIKEQTESKILVHVLEDLMEEINNGKFLADALERYEYLFGPFFVNIVRVGESSGTLAKNLLYLADELRRSKALQGKVRSAMVYPMVILVATLGVAGFLTFYVFPKLIPVFGSLHVQLPITTLIMLATVHAMQSYGVEIVLALVVLLIGARVIVKKVEAIRYGLHVLMIYTPVLGPLIIGVNVVNFTRVLGLLLKSGVKIVESIEITASTFSNLVYRKVLRASEDEIRKGAQLGTYLGHHKRLFPPLVYNMVTIGESTGNLEENLEYLAEYYDDEIDGKLHMLTSIIEPLMLLIMGMLVGFVALSIITPIYSISQGIK